MRAEFDYVKNRLNKMHCILNTEQNDYLINVQLHITGKMYKSLVDKEYEFSYDVRCNTNIYELILSTTGISADNYASYFTKDISAFLKEKAPTAKQVFCQLLKTNKNEIKIMG